MGSNYKLMHFTLFTIPASHIFSSSFTLFSGKLQLQFAKSVLSLQNLDCKRNEVPSIIDNILHQKETSFNKEVKYK